jgi:hypothetical protein
VFLVCKAGTATLIRAGPTEVPMLIDSPYMLCDGDSFAMDNGISFKVIV